MNSITSPITNGMARAQVITGLKNLARSQVGSAADSMTTLGEIREALNSRAEGDYQIAVGDSGLTTRTKLNSYHNSASRVVIDKYLFEANEVGLYLDPSDITTMYQDYTGSIPVTKPGDFVGLILDKSKGLLVGPELATNGDFSSSTGWVLTNPAITISNGKLRAAATINASAAYITNKLVSGVYYRVTYTVESISGGTVRFWSGGATSGMNRTTPGTYSELFVSAGTSIGFQFVTTGVSAVIDNISVKQISGNHAAAPSAASSARPIYGIEPYGGRRNLLTYSEQFSNTSWIKNGIVLINPDAEAAPDGTLTAERLVPSTDLAAHTISQNATVVSGQTYTASIYLKSGGYDWIRLSIGSTPFGTNYIYLNTSTGERGFSSGFTNIQVANAGNGWWRLSATAVATSSGNGGFIMYPNITNSFSTFAGDGTSGTIVWGAQLEASGSVTNYQRVTTEYDITEAGVPTCHYLKFDGSNDFLATQTVTPNTSKVSVFAGLRKLSDTNAGVVVELSPDTTTSNGSFFMGAPGVAGASTYTFTSKGTTGQIVTSSGVAYTAPTTNLVVGRGDISGDRSIIRIDGDQSGSSVTGDQGTGNYLAYPIYIGKRSTGLFFNGRIYCLVVYFSATNLATDRTKLVERCIGDKAGVPIAIL